MLMIMLATGGHVTEWACMFIFLISIRTTDEAENAVSAKSMESF